MDLIFQLFISPNLLFPKKNPDEQKSFEVEKHLFKNRSTVKKKKIERKVEGGSIPKFYRWKRTLINQRGIGSQDNIFDDSAMKKI